MAIHGGDEASTSSQARKQPRVEHERGVGKVLQHAGANALSGRERLFKLLTEFTAEVCSALLIKQQLVIEQAAMEADWCTTGTIGNKDVVEAALHQWSDELYNGNTAIKLLSDPDSNYKYKKWTEQLKDVKGALGELARIRDANKTLPAHAELPRVLPERRG